MEVNYRYTSKKENNIDELMQYVKNIGYGKMLPLSQCAKILQYNINNELEFKRFKSLMCRVRNLLIDYGYILKSIPKVGYYILKPSQISGYVYRTYTLRTLKMLEKQDRILKHTNTTNLADIRKKEFSEMQSLTQYTYEAIDNTIRTSDYFKNKDIYDNLKGE